MATLEMVRRAVGIDFSAAGLLEWLRLSFRTHFPIHACQIELGQIAPEIFLTTLKQLCRSLGSSLGLAKEPEKRSEN
jgi:hypothetical protein